MLSPSLPFDADSLDNSCFRPAIVLDRSREEASISLCPDRRQMTASQDKRAEDERGRQEIGKRRICRVAQDTKRGCCHIFDRALLSNRPEHLLLLEPVPHAYRGQKVDIRYSDVHHGAIPNSMFQLTPPPDTKVTHPLGPGGRAF
jgi:hypothetical protein